MMRISACEPATIATAQATATRSSARLTNCCPEPIVIGRPGRTSCSLANATLEPQKDTEPTIAAKRLRIAT
jgi:hypothetical protein